MKILELCLSPGLGGLELYVWRSAEALSASDSVIAVLNERGRLRDYFANSPIETYFLRTRVRPLPLAAARQLARIIDREEVDVLHLHWGKDLPLAALAKALSRRKPRLVYTRQMLLTRAKTDVYHTWLYRRMDRMLTITRALAEAARARLPAVSRDRVETLYYGVKAPGQHLTPEARASLRGEWGIPERAFVVGLFGRIEEAKGQHLMLEALEHAAREDVALHALIVGHTMDDGYLARLKREVQERDLGGRVVFRDFVKEPQQWMQACDCVALTTHTETFGLVLVEAMRAGVAVVGSDRGGVPEIIDHDETGLLFASGSSTSLAEQLLRLEGDPVLRERLARAGQAKADRTFDDQTHFRRLREVFRATLSAESAR